MEYPPGDGEGVLSENFAVCWFDRYRILKLILVLLFYRRTNVSVKVTSTFPTVIRSEMIIAGVTGSRLAGN